MNYAIIGLGFISGRHIQAIEDVGGKLLLACDIDESKRHKAKGAVFYKDWEEMFEDKAFPYVDYVVICTPNYLHFPMMLASVKAGKKVICEKPLVVDLDDLETLKTYEDQISCVLQLRNNPELIKYRENLKGRHTARFAVCVHRDDWYYKSWKNDRLKSGGLAFNIGAHYFDILCWFFGPAIRSGMVMETDRLIQGFVAFKKCDAIFKLSIDQPIDNQYRYLRVDDHELDLTKHFEGLHTRVYENILKGNSIRISDVENSLKLIATL